ncbi:hypothetical protein SAMN02982917_5283 [Azospirillum oryzae]|uniref:Uncharacterized protein n=1 Tax=Azospirillum oryzae TaxID=286727 RepID=A0A1X7H991_9PROT|nr:hypothetical protein [Azospirillum oryzae]SMF82047.1 hypothetical protein SAMN02982917_5283 [Azospirillum oryzae]
MNSDRVALQAFRLRNFLFALCKRNKVQIELSDDCLVQVASHYQKDLGKLEYHQGNEISVNKRIAGLAFWVRRLKPIRYAAKIHEDVEICDINEQVSVWLMHELLLRCADHRFAAAIMKDVDGGPRASRLQSYLAAYWKISDSFNYTSLIYNLRFRNISPHHMALLLDSITTGFVLKHS